MKILMYDEGNELAVNGSNNHVQLNQNPESLLAANDSGKGALAVGVRFNPTDELLAGYYLAGKVAGSTGGDVFQQIKDVDVYEHEPSKLSGFADDMGYGKMYFFTTLQMKYRNGKNVSRLAPSAFWKKTGKFSDIKDKDGELIASKTSLAYYKNDQNSSKPLKTDWLMKEYMLGDKEYKMLSSLTLCVVYNKRKHCETEIECYESMTTRTSKVHFRLLSRDLRETTSKSIVRLKSNAMTTRTSKDYNPDFCLQNHIMSCADNYADFPRKRHRAYSDLHEAFYAGVSKSSSENQSNESSSNIATYLESQPAVDIPFVKSDQNTRNPGMGPRASTCSTVQNPDHYLELDPENILNFDNEDIFWSLSDLLSDDY
ncbi:NAC domain-containing protein [Melia azedarach]|uniref:NAC domain-containing protein n=1 Tax=Melia azedarach TaxID=155640 RepID=A0ACC1YJP2_MELAZ|nr:NAC domain-containing protein [Melia azedarach]